MTPPKQSQAFFVFKKTTWPASSCAILLHCGTFPLRFVTLSLTKTCCLVSSSAAHFHWRAVSCVYPFLFQRVWIDKSSSLHSIVVPALQYNIHVESHVQSSDWVQDSQGNPITFAIGPNLDIVNSALLVQEPIFELDLMDTTASGLVNLHELRHSESNRLLVLELSLISCSFLVVDLFDTDPYWFDLARSPTMKWE